MGWDGCKIPVSSQLLKRLLAPKHRLAFTPAQLQESLHPCASSSAWPVLYPVARALLLPLASGLQRLQLRCLSFSSTIPIDRGSGSNPLTELDLVCFLFSSPRLKIKKEKQERKFSQRAPRVSSLVRRNKRKVTRARDTSGESSRRMSELHVIGGAWGKKRPKLTVSKAHPTVAQGASGVYSYLGSLSIALLTTLVRSVPAWAFPLWRCLGTLTCHPSCCA